MLPAGKDFVTTAPAATTVLSAIVTPGKMVTPHPYIVSYRDGLKLFVPLFPKWYIWRYLMFMIPCVNKAIRPHHNIVTNGHMLRNVCIYSDPRMITNLQCRRDICSVFKINITSAARYIAFDHSISYFRSNLTANMYETGKCFPISSYATLHATLQTFILSPHIQP